MEVRAVTTNSKGGAAVAALQRWLRLWRRLRNGADAHKTR
jgi:hypothetical protein